MVLEDGERIRVVMKLAGPVAELPAARGVKPASMLHAGREAWMYESVLASDGIADAPRLLRSGHAGDGGQWLLLEWAGSVDLGQVGARAVWCEAAARLARMHAWGESRIEILSRGSAVRWDDPSLHLAWARRACAGSASRDLLSALWRRYEVVAERLATMPKTLVHGDLNASNVLVTRVGAATRIRIIDWETAGVGPGLLDLATITSGRLPELHRAAMIDAYRANLDGSRLGSLSAGEFDDALDWCRLATAVRWLGWSPGWSAPAAHAHDWRGETLALAHRLGLLGE
jgi:Ser/Thr protein kinase RdoA (MazF antagonist)